MNQSPSLPIFDLHQDLLLHIEHPEYFTGAPQTNWELLEAANVKTLFATAFPVPADGNWYDKVLNSEITNDFRSYRKYISEKDEWSIIRDGADLGAETRGVILHIEGLNTIEDTEADWQQLEDWYDLGWRSLGLVWNKSNALGGGTENIDDELTDFGQKVIEWCLERNMVIDCAHMNRKTFAGAVEVLKAHQRSILVSHGNADALCPSERNFTDEQIKTISDSGGVIGVFFSGAYVSPEENTIEKVADHIEHFRSVGGDSVVALGTDLGGVTKGVPVGLEDITKVQNLLIELHSRGWSEEQLTALASRNAMRVVKAYLSSNQLQS